MQVVCAVVPLIVFVCAVVPLILFQFVCAVVPLLVFQFHDSSLSVDYTFFDSLI